LLLGVTHHTPRGLLHQQVRIPLMLLLLLLGVTSKGPRVLPAPPLLLLLL
jgi:hypothetical protein